VPLLIGANSGEANSFIPDLLFNPSKLLEIDAAWEDYYGPKYLRAREELKDVTDDDIELSVAVREFFFAPDGVIELDKLDTFQSQYSDALFR